MLQSALGVKSAQGQCPWHPFSQYWLNPELQATTDIQENLGSFRGHQSAPCSAGRILVCASGRQRGMHPVSGSWRLCATDCSHCHPLTHSSFLSTPRRVQFANRNPLFYLKPGVPGCSSCYPLGRKLPLRTAVGAKFDYSVARTKVWGQPRTQIPREGPFACLHKLPAALSTYSKSQE